MSRSAEDREIRQALALAMCDAIDNSGPPTGAMMRALRMVLGRLKSDVELSTATEMSLLNVLDSCWERQPPFEQTLIAEIANKMPRGPGGAPF